MNDDIAWLRRWMEGANDFYFADLKERLRRVIASAETLAASANGELESC